MPKRTLLVASAGCGKTRRLLEHFKEALEKHPGSPQPPLAFLLPSEEHAARIRDLLLRSPAVEAIASGSIDTLERFVESWAGRYSRPVASLATKFLVIREILSSAAFESFSEVRDFPGFVRLLADFLTELKRNFVGPRIFRDRLQAVAEKFPAVRQKVEDLARFYDSYQVSLEARGLADLDDAFFFLARDLEKGRGSAPHLDAVWIDGFHDFTALQLTWVKLLAARCDEITVTLTFDPSPGRRFLFGPVKETRDALLALGFEEVRLENSNQRTARPDLLHLEDALFFVPRKTREGSAESVKIFEAVGAEGEVESIAREIARLQRSEAYHYSDFCVILRQIGDYEPLFRSVFSSFGIPLEIHERRKLRANALIRTLVAVLTVWRDGWKRADVLRFLKSSYAGYDPRLCAHIELAALERGLREGRKEWLLAWENFPLESERLALFKRLADWEDTFRRAKRPAQAVSAFRRFLSDQGIRNRLAEFQDEQSLDDNVALGELYRLLDALGEAGFDAEVPFESWVARVLDAIDLSLYSVRSAHKNKVQLYDVSLARQKEYKVVFLAGLLAQRFPLLIREDPLLSDEERAVFNEGRPTLRERLPRQDLERYLFYLSVTRAQEKLYLTWPRYDVEGKETLASFYVEELDRAFEKPIERKRWGRAASGHLLEAVSEAEAARMVVSAFFSPRAKGASKNGDLAAAVVAYNQLIRNAEFRKALGELFLSIEGRLESPDLRGSLMAGKTFSPTGLELYAKCPYRYFAHAVLHLQDEEEGISVLDLGTVLHKVLEQFFSGVKAHRSFSPGELDREILKLLEPLLAEIFPRGELAFRRRLRELELFRALGGVIQKELAQGPPVPGFEFWRSEAAFQMEWEGVPLSGRIDRVDRDGSKKRAVVFDYKRSLTDAQRAVRARIRDGLHLQLPVYGEALARVFGLEPAGAYLYGVRGAKVAGYWLEAAVQADENRKVPGEKLSSKDLEEQQRQAAYFVKTYAEGVRNGEIPVLPKSCEATCPFDSLCRIERWQLPRIYEAHDRANPFLEESSS